MLKEKDYIFSRMNMLIDLCVAAAAFVLAHFLRNQLLAPYIAPTILAPSRFGHYAWALPVFAAAAVFVLYFNGYYNSQRIRDAGQIMKTLVLSCVEVTVVCLAVIYMIHKKDLVSRGQMILAPAMLFILLMIKTALMKKILTHFRRRGYNYRALLFVGSGEKLGDFLYMVESHPFWGFRAMGIMTDDPARHKKGDKFKKWEILGEAGETLDFLENHPVDEVIFFPAKMKLDELEPLLEGCETMGVTTRLAMNIFSPKVAEVGLDRYETVPLVTFSPTKKMSAALFFKYAFDRAAALFLLIAFSPLMLAAALIIWFSSNKGEPVLYRQRRSGLNGKPFTLYKFRSMKVGAEKELEKLREKSDVDGPVFKMKNDPRVTPFGRFIRRYSIDELPQLLNVLKGEMSLVGPRPPIPEEVKKYDRWQRRRLSMRPGITCLWQVMGRNRLDFETWMRLDLQYIDNWSLWLDATILARTVLVVITGYGAS